MSIHILGTNHVSAQSAQMVKEHYASLQPDIIAIELDKNRLEGLLSKQKTKITLNLIPEIGLVGFLFLLAGRFIQKKFGKIARLEPGIDMLSAVDLAKEYRKKLVLIDRPIQKTLRALSTQLTFKEKRRLLYDLTLGWVFGKKQKIQMNIQGVPDADVLSQLIIQIKDRYPTFYSVLLDQRNFFMAQRLWFLAQRHPEQSILAVVGAAHVPGMQVYINEMNKNPPRFPLK